LAELICDVVGFRGKLKWDRSKPDGTPRKLLDVSKIKTLGWQPTVPLRDGIARFYEWFLDNYAPRSMASVR
jgi:GDP-L-fucose synthase